MYRPDLALDLDIARALRKGRIRRGILLALPADGERTIPQLTQLLRTERQLVVWAVNGHWPKFRDSLALGHLGLVRWVWRPSGFSLALTPRGREVAARLASGWEP